MTEELKELYSRPADELLSFFMGKWMSRGFIAWILSATLFGFTLIEFIYTLIAILGFNTWMIRGEWRQYKRWINSKERKDQSNPTK